MTKLRHLDCRSFVELFMMSLQTATLPYDWRRANVTPIFKKGSRHSPSNYRPISLTSLVVKVLERLIHTNVTEFLTRNSILCPFHHGFRKGHSCQIQLLATVHQWAASIDKRASTHAIFLDFPKHSTVCHTKGCSLSWTT